MDDPRNNGKLSTEVYNDQYYYQKKKTREAKEKEPNKRARKLKHKKRSFESYKVHRKVKELIGSVKYKQLENLTNSEDRIIVDKKTKSWK